MQACRPRRGRSLPWWRCLSRSARNDSRISTAATWSMMRRRSGPRACPAWSRISCASCEVRRSSHRCTGRPNSRAQLLGELRATVPSAGLVSPDRCSGISDHGLRHLVAPQQTADRPPVVAPARVLQRKQRLHGKAQGIGQRHADTARSYVKAHDPPDVRARRLWCARGCRLAWLSVAGWFTARVRDALRLRRRMTQWAGELSRGKVPG